MVLSISDADADADAERGKLILLPPASQSATCIIEKVFPGETTRFQVIDLAGMDLRSFNAAILSAQADKALLCVDAVFGLEKRDVWAQAMACLASIPHIVVALDGMALTDWSRERFEELREAVTDAAPGLNCARLDIIPLDFSSGENVDEASSKPAWYQGPNLASLLAAGQEGTPARVEAVDGADGASQTSDQFSVHLCWQGDAPMLPGRHYQLVHGGQRVEAQIGELKHRLSPETMEHQAARKLLAGEVGYCNISLDAPIVFAPFEQDRKAGSFTLCDEKSGERLAFGLIKHALRRATNIKWQDLLVDKTARAGSKRQKPCVLWFTGLSGSGKSTVASFVDKKLHAEGRHTYVLDGDNVRHGLCRDLGFTDADRVENLRRISETAKLFVDAGLVTLVSFISPFRSERNAARALFGDGEFVEIFVDTPLEVCEARDIKGLYKKARAGQLKNFTGIDSPYEPPENAEIVLQGAAEDPERLADLVIGELVERQLIGPDERH